jgi:protein-S-isoprenylcysteine O-methyltransferase Ste14
MDRVTLVRASALYVPLTLAWIAWLVSSPGRRDRAAALLATAWNLSALLTVHAVATGFGWWSYGVSDASVAGVPVDLYLGWAVAWGALPALLGRNLSVGTLVILALVVDVVAMPQLAPVVQLGDSWLLGEAVAVITCLVPAQLLANWTRHDTRLPQRAALQAIAFAGLALAVLPAAILEWSGGSWTPLVARPGWITGLLAQLIAAGGLLGVSAVQEFATRGRGTPVPFDPPKRVVTSGPYAYIRNPMQFSAALVMLGWGAMLESWWVGAAGVMAVIYGAGFAAGDERGDLERRFGPNWGEYARRVRAWVPRWRPVDWTATPVVTLGTPTLYVSEECGRCSEIRAWLEARNPIGLAIIPAERHPSRSLTRITYDPGDGSEDAVGVAALGRALEHLNLAWAMLGMFVRLPGICWFIQVVTDASGGGPMPVRRYCERSEWHHPGGKLSFVNDDSADDAETAGSGAEFSATTR